MDSLTLMMVAGIGFAAACFGLVAAAVIWFRVRRVPKASLTIAGAAFGMMILSLAALPPGYDPDEVERVARLHAEFEPRLEAYRRDHGAYPPTLEAAGIATPQTPYGPLDYRLHAGKQGQPVYELSMGDYGHHGFVAFWNSGRRTWDVDM